MSIVLITGCSSGLGRAMTGKFCGAGDTVYATVRSESAAVELAAVDERIHPLILEVGDPAAIRACVAQIIARSGRIDVLVNNAGIGLSSMVEETADTAMEQVLRVNFFGPVWLTQTVLPHMRAAGSGRVIMVSSLSALVGLPSQGFYSASKAALELLAESLSAEVDRFGIRVSVIEPGLFRTAMPEKIARTIRVSAESPYAELLTFLQERSLARIGAGDDPERVAELVLAIARDPAPAFRYPAGAQAGQIVNRIAGLDEAGRSTFVRDVQDTHWWSTGDARPAGA